MKTAKRHVNIPVFIPHLGCPNDCIFCNQRSISGKRSFDADAVKDEISTALATVGGCDAEIAFFGGSFTGIDRGLMIYLLETAEEFVRDGRVSSIRLSTRPDYISPEILDILSRYTVKTVELGIQSMDDKVLAAAKRGHTVYDSENACRLVKQYGFSLIGQMMTGLPCSTPESEIMTAERICALSADGARIYPTMVFHGTELEKMTLDGRYVPPVIDDAVSRTAGALGVFVSHRVPVIRIGLHSGETLYAEDGIAFGAYHPAMGELVEGELYYRAECRALEEISETTVGKKALFVIPTCDTSKAAGQKKRNSARLRERYGLSAVKFREDDGISAYHCRVSLF